MPRDCIYTNLEFRQIPPHRASPSAVLTGLLTTLVDQVREWRARVRSRHLLQRLDERMLRDVGLSRADVARECGKHFWQH
jgi:uncharacterized protein YjiS (DUF1127 family)